MIDETTKSWYYEGHWEAQESGRGRDPTGVNTQWLQYGSWHSRFRWAKIFHFS